MLTGGRSSLNKVVVLVFADDASTPQLALKFGRVTESELALDREAAALDAIGDRVPSSVAEIPRIIFNTRLSGVRAVGETAVEGRALSATLTAERYPEIALSVADLLASFVIGSEPLRPALWWERLVEPVFEDFARQFRSLPEIRALEDVRRQLEAMPALPLVPEHRDCSPWNVLLTPHGRLALLDWESAEPHGLPVLDLIYFLSNASFLLEGTLGSGREVDTYAAVVGGIGSLGRVFTDALARYGHLTGLDPEVLAPLRTFAWMIHARAQPYPSVATSLERASAELGTGNLFVTLWREDVRRQHLAGT